MASLALGVKFIPAAGGTADFVYASTVQGYINPTTGGGALVNGKTYRYRAENAALTEFEYGTGVWNSSTNTLTRASIYLTSNANAIVTFSAAPQVGIIQYVGDVLQFDDAMSLTDAQKSQGRANLGVPGFNFVTNPSGELATPGLGSRTDVTYDFDRWVTLTETAAVTISSVAAAENTTPFMMRSLQAQASAQRMGRIQWFENLACANLRGQSVVLSARVRTSAATTIRYAIIEWTGTADTITKDIVNNWASATFTTGNFFTSTSTTLVATGSLALSANTLTDITALTGTVSGSMNNLAVFFWTDSQQAQNATMDVAKVKLEVGSVATPFVAPTPQQIRTECQRFYHQSYDDGVAPGTASLLAGLRSIQIGTNTITNFTGYGTISHPVEMRATPTGTIYGYQGGSGKVSDATPTDLAASSGTVGSLTNAKEFSVVNTSGGTVTTTNNTVNFHYKMDANL